MRKKTKKESKMNKENKCPTKLGRKKMKDKQNKAEKRERDIQFSKEKKGEGRVKIGVV